MIDKSSVRVAGAVATTVALAILWIGSGFMLSVTFPPTAIADFIIRQTPGDIATAFIEALQHWALRFLAIAVVIGTVLAGAQALVWLSRDRLRPVAAAVVLFVISFAVALADYRSGNLIGTTIAAILAAAAYAAVARSVYASRVGAIETDPGRRRVLALGAGGALGLAAAGGAIGWIARRLAGPDRNVTLVEPSDPATLPPSGDFPDISGLSPEVTSAEEHYIVDIDLVKPVVEAAGWTLAVTGEVENPLKLTFTTLQNDYEVVEDLSVLTCISNEVGGPLVGHSAWGGVRLRDVLEDARPLSEVVDVIFTAADGYKDSIPLEAAMDPAVILAVTQNGEPLTQGHGFPCRVRVPAIYGMKNVKWVRSIELVSRDYKGYWMQRGWSDEAIIRTQSRIDVAGDDLSATVGEQTWIAGVAWAGDRGVTEVEVSVDGGRTWSAAELKRAASDISWRLWAYAWTPEAAGTAVVMCRATDGTGAVQTTKERPPHPSGASGLHTIEIDVG